MKNLLLIIVVLISFGGYAQKLNKTKNGYTEVVEVESTKKEIQQKLDEWTTVIYKSAKKDIQLSSEDKIVLTGNFIIPLKVNALMYDYRVLFQLTFSVRDNKYKIDLNPLVVTHLSGNYDAGLGVIREFLFNDVLSKEDYLPILKNNLKEGLINLGQSEEKARRYVQKTAEKLLEKSYANHEDNKPNWDKEITSIFQDIKDYVNQSNDDDDW